VQYKYTPSGKLSTVIASPSSVIASEREAIHTTSYTYDKLGRVSERILPDSTTTKYEYNQLGTLSSLIHSKDNNILDQFHYTHDPVGNIVQIEKYRSGIETDNGVFKYVYDPLNRLTQAIRGDGSSKQYEYDPLGNRTSVIATARQRGGKQSTVTHHSYNACNQLVQTADGSDITDYLYDKRGNLTQTTVNGQLQHRYTFDATNMMTAAHSPIKGDATYTYNGFRNRVAKLENMANTNYVLDMTRPYDNLLATQGAQTQTFIWGNNLLSASNSEANSPNTFYYLQDHLGSPIRLLGESNHDTAMSYDEFGVQEVMAGGVAQPFGFTGYQTDSVSGLCYAQARYYTPQAARFTAQDAYWNPGNMIWGEEPNGITPDSFAILQSKNLYAYAINNPIKYIDPTGFDCADDESQSFLRDFADGAWNKILDKPRDLILGSIIGGSAFAGQSGTPYGRLAYDFFFSPARRGMAGTARNSALTQSDNTLLRYGHTLAKAAPYIIVGIDVVGGGVSNVRNGVSWERTTSDAVADAAIGAGVVTAAGFAASVVGGAKKGAIVGSVVPGKGTLAGVVVGGLVGIGLYAAANAAGIRDAISDRVYNGVSWVQGRWSNRPKWLGGES